MQHAFIVLDVAGYQNTIERAGALFAAEPIEVCIDEQLVKVDPIPELSNARRDLILKALLQETVDQHCRFRMPDNPINEIAQALCDCAIPDTNQLQIAESFLCHDPVDNMVVSIMSEVGAMISKNAECEWTLMHGNSMWALIRGRDYRIEEYERLTKDTGGEGVSIQLTSLIQYLRKQTQNVVGSNCPEIPWQTLVINAINLRYPLIEFEQPTVGVFPDTELQQLGWQRSDIYEQLVQPTVAAFIVSFLLGRVETSREYKAKLSDKFLLTITPTVKARTQLERYMLELRESINNGDWVPEADRRQLEYWESHGRLE